jgi:DNA-binding winged helix-turn-helix (wHTH) protein/tetratricopeptide (TPR) repeat protein
MSALENPVYRFRGFELQPSERRLLGEGQPIALTPKVFDTLVLLVERAGHVVSKDELMQRLWPRGYVDESNLTKHIWLIRRALGDEDHDSRFIETVPKRGYRFVATVTRGSEAAPAPAESPAAPLEAPAAGRPTPALPAPPAAPARPARWLLASVGVAVLVAVTVVWRMSSRPPPAANRPGHTVAFVVFSNLSGNAKDAWLARALTEMLGAELSVAADLRVVPDELVRDASADLAPAAAGGYAPETLARLHRRLDADYIVSGNYLVSGAADDAPLRVDIALQDGRDGTLLASVSQQAGVSGVLALVTQAGATLRDRLGLRPPSAASLSLLANAQPPNVDVARRVGFALDALQHYDAARARDELLEAIAESPAYAPAYSYLAQAWTALGYRDKALAAAEQAARYSGNLPPEQRLLAQAIVLAAHADWSKAADTWGSLAQLKPLNPDYRLQRIDAQIAAGAPVPAQATWHELQRLPDAGSDPRTELAAARIAEALDDAKGSAQHAAAALRAAQQHDAAGLIADAELELAGARMHLNQNAEASKDLSAAIDAYHSIRNPRGEANARRQLASALTSLSRPQDAREEYQRALALDQSIGDVGGVARVYRDLCSMLWLAGDRDGAQVAARHALQLGRDIGDLALQAWTLQALATIASDEAASDEVLDEYREVIALDVRGGFNSVWALTNYADVQRLRGELAGAQASCGRAQREAATLTDPQFAIFSGFTCALIEADRGNTEAARKGFGEIVRRVGRGDDTTYANNALMMLAQLDMDEAHWGAARDQLLQASRGFAAAEERTGEADAQARLALCAQALGDTAARERAADRARSLRQSINSKQEVYMADIALARLADQAHAGGAAPERLLGLAADAERRQWLAWALEAKLSAWELLRAHGSATADALRAQIAKSARQHGYGRILKQLQRPEPRRPS